MQTQPNWDRHQILAEVRRRYGTLSALARLHGITGSNLSVAFSQPYKAGERIIARAVNQPLHVLWPDRWDKNDNRLGIIANTIPRNAPLASQKSSARLTKTGGALT